MKHLILQALTYSLILIAILGCGKNPSEPNDYDIALSPNMDEMEKSFDIVEDSIKQQVKLMTEVDNGKKSTDETMPLIGEQLKKIAAEIDTQDNIILTIKGLSPPDEAKTYHDLLVKYYRIRMTTSLYFYRSMSTSDEDVSKSAMDAFRELIVEGDSINKAVVKEGERYLKSKK